MLDLNGISLYIGSEVRWGTPRTFSQAQLKGTIAEFLRGQVNAWVDQTSFRSLNGHGTTLEEPRRHKVAVCELVRDFPNPSQDLFSFWGKRTNYRKMEEGMTLHQPDVRELVTLMGLLTFGQSRAERKKMNDKVHHMMYFTEALLDKQDDGKVVLTPADVKEAMGIYVAMMQVLKAQAMKAKSTTGEQ